MKNTSRLGMLCPSQITLQYSALSLLATASKKLGLIALACGIFGVKALAQSPELIVPLGHTKEVTGMAYSPDEKYMASTGWDGNLILWETSTHKQLYSRHKGRGNASVAYSHDGKTVAVGGYEIVIYEALSGKVKAELSNVSQIQRMCFTPDDKYIIAANWEDKVIIIDAQTGKLFSKPNTGEWDGGASDVRMSPDGKTFAAAGNNGSVKIWNYSIFEMLSLDGMKATQTLTAPNMKAISGICYSKDGSRLAALDFDGNIVIWKLGAMSKVEFQTKVKAPEYQRAGIECSQDGKHFIVWTSYDGIHWVETNNGKITKTVEKKGFGAVSGVAHSAKKTTLLIGDDSFGILEFNDQNELKRSGTFQRQVSGTELFQISKDGKRLYSNSLDGELAVWDLKRGRLSHKIKYKSGADAAARDFHISKDEKLAYMANGKSISIIDLSSQKTLRTLDFGAFVWHLEVSPDEKFLYAASDGVFSKLSMKAWSLPEFKEVAVTPQAGATSYSMVKFSGDSKWLYVTEANAQVARYSTANWKSEPVVGKGARVAFAPNDAVPYFYNQKQLTKDGITKFLLFPDAQSWDMNLSNDGSLLALGGNRILALMDAKLLSQSAVNGQAHQDGVMSVGFSADNQFVISSGTDKATKIWDKNLNLQATLYTFRDSDDWAVIHANGRFDASEGMLKKMYFVKDNQTMPLGSLSEKFLAPGLLRRVLAGETIEAPGVELKKLKKAPNVRMSFDKARNLEVSDEAEAETIAWGQEQIVVKVSAESEEANIEEIDLYINGKLAQSSTRNLEVSDDASTELNKSFTISLLPGQNTLKAIAINDQRTESLPDVVTINYVPSKPTPSTVTGRGIQLHLIVVGINNYKNTKYNLNYAEADARAIKEAIETGGKNMFSKINTTLIFNESANKSGISAALNKVKSEATANDVFIFYFAGHGVVDNQKSFFLVPTDVTQLYGNDGALAQKGFSTDELQAFSREIKAQKQLFILDACQSAGALNQIAARGAAEEKAIAQLARSTGTHWLTASGSEQFASEFAQLGHGAFTYVLLEALSGKADTGDQKVSVKELDAYLQNNVPEVTAKYKGTPQYPASYGFGNDFPIFILK